MIVYLGLGSNQGDRIGTIQQAMRFLTDSGEIRVLSASSFYETEPVDFKDQEWFVNAALAVDTSLGPEELLEQCQRVEKMLGRVRNPQKPKGPRSIDIDILLYDNLVMNEANLIIPHPRLHTRACMLVPLLEVNPRIVHPVFNKTIEQLHSDLEAPEEVLLYGTRRVSHY